MLITQELNKIGFSNILSCETIKESDETIVCRFFNAGKSYVAKYYVDAKNSFEILWYKVLKEAGLKTLQALSSTDRLIVFEDLDSNPLYRFGKESDLSNEKVAFQLGKWFKDFHNIGYEYLKDNPISGFNEFDIITQSNIEKLTDSIDDSDGTGSLLRGNFALINNKFNVMQKTFTYRDFWYVNFIVAADESEAFIFDFDKSGTGLAYNDILYMKMCLSEPAQLAFMEGYGDIRVNEIDIATLYLDLYRLISYLEHIDEEEVPGWAKQHLDKYLNGELKDLIERVMK